MCKPLVSVILPVYNGMAYVEEAIDSILAQTFSNFELIVIDDGSIDGSEKVLKVYASKDSRVRVVMRENRGLATTLNDGIDMACGDWIARMDQDDVALPHRLQRQLEWLEKTQADIIGSWVRRFGTADERVVRLCHTDEAIKMEMLFRSPFAHPTVIMRTRLAKQLRYDKNWEKAEDYDMWERAAEAGWKMANVPEVLLMYRVHSDQISTLTLDRQQQLGREISRRYWRFMIQTMLFDEAVINDALQILWTSNTEPNVDALDVAFKQLMRHAKGESRDVLFSHAARLYLKVAANCPDVVSRWNRLNREFGPCKENAISQKLLLFRWFRIRMDGAFFHLLRKLYLWKSSL